MLAELIGENVVSKFIVQKLKRFNNVGQVNNADNVTHILTYYIRLHRKEYIKICIMYRCMCKIQYQQAVSKNLFLNKLKILW